MSRTPPDRERTDQSASARSPYGAFAIRGALGIAVVALLLKHYDARPVFAALSRERLAYFAATIMVYLAGQALTAWRWQLLGKLNAIAGSYFEYLAFYFIGVFTNLFVPGLVGGDAARALYLGRSKNRLGEAIASVVADRGIGLLAVFWFAGGCALAVHTIELPANMLRITIALGAGAFAAWMLSPLGAWLVPRLSGRFAGLGGFLQPMLPYLSRPIAMVPAIVLSFILQLSLVYGQYLLALGLGLHIPFATMMLCIPIANVIASLPITLNGLGVREATYLVLFGYAGIGRGDAIALGLLWFAATALAGLSGIIAFVTTSLPAAPADDAPAAGEAAD